MMTLTAVQRTHAKLSRFPEFRELRPEAQRHLLQLVCAGELPQHDVAILSAIESIEAENARQEA